MSKQLLTGEWELEAVEIRLEEGLDLDWRSGTTAVGLDLAHRQVSLSDGDRVGYDGLVIATGTVPRSLPDTGGLAGVHSLRTLNDSLAIRAELDRAPRVAIVGAGFIGAEVASAARKRDLEVTVIEALSVPLEMTLGAEIGEVWSGLHRDHGTRLILGRRVLGLEGHGRVEGVRLETGELVAADVVIVGIGVRPATDWLASSGVALADGVMCDETCAVLDGAGRVIDGVVAAGDVARWPNRLFGEEMRVEHWDNAIAQGGAAARRLLGGVEPYAPVPFFWSDQYNVKLQFLGTTRPGDEMVVLEGSLEDRRFVAGYGRQGRLVGALAVNQVHRAASYRKLIAEAADVPAG